jgi:hypothetical protein
VLTVFGMLALTFMMLMYALERRARHFVLAFALGAEFGAFRSGVRCSSRR